MTELSEMLERSIERYYPPRGKINVARCRLLDDCFRASFWKRGMFSITAPTGSGKTIALMRFALNHAVANGMERVICVEPYTAIIEQNASVYKGILGAENVLEHHSNCDYGSSSDDSCDVGNRMRFASENWDVPVVVTTSVQFFESLLSNRPSRCRKIHNIANSVIVLDEAQMIPVDYMTVCLNTLCELVRNYGCTIVLCSATQPALEAMLDAEAMPIREIVGDVDSLFSELRRVVYRSLGRVEVSELAEKIVLRRQSLCVVNSRKAARRLYEEIARLSPVAPVFCLTTLMFPQHRKSVLGQISRLLDDGNPCTVVATSLVEAGVDLDFENVFREAAGIDSIVQAAGRCNREMRRPREESEVCVFELSDSCEIPIDLQQRAAVARSVLPAIAGGASLDFDSPDLAAAYFDRLYKVKGPSGLDKHGVACLLSGGKMIDGILGIPFAEAADKTHLIEEGSYDVVIPVPDYEGELEAIRGGFADRAMMRRIGRISVGVYGRDLKNLIDCGAVSQLGGDMYELIDTDRYRSDVGLDLMTVDLPDLIW